MGGETLKGALTRLRRMFYEKVETAYAERDAAAENSYEQAFAEGEAHAYREAETALNDAGGRGRFPRADGRGIPTADERDEQHRPS